jgi:tRNA 2-thiocytidine biosynthesis protein TtcA
MLSEGDRVLVGLSGGKDSLTMLVLLLELQRRAPFKFSVAACTVEPGAAEFDPSPLKAYVTPQLGIPYFYESDSIIQRAKGVGGKFSICAYCARQKRGILYSTALREGYNVLALAQHADDLAESFLMSAMHNGRLRTMKVSLLLYRIVLLMARDAVAGALHQRQRHPRSAPTHVSFFSCHAVAAVHPNSTDTRRIYVRELMTRAYADAALLPVIEDNCPACFKVCPA